MKCNKLKVTTYLLASFLVFSFNACEGDGKDGAASLVNILTEGNPPVAEAGPNQSVLAGDTVTLDGSASTDSDGTIAKYLWTIPGIGTKEGITVTKTIPVGTSAGSYVTNLTVTDNDGNTDNDTMTITVTAVIQDEEPVNNTAPVANSRDRILGNCSSAPVEIVLNASDADGDALVYSVVMQPASGANVVIVGNSATYTNTTVGCGSLQGLDGGGGGSIDSFTFKVNDGTVDSNIATVTLSFNVLL